jgi:hypothetical protein
MCVVMLRGVLFLGHPHVVRGGVRGHPRTEKRKAHTGLGATAFTTAVQGVQMTTACAENRGAVRAICFRLVDTHCRVTAA